MKRRAIALSLALSFALAAGVACRADEPDPSAGYDLVRSAAPAAQLGHPLSVSLSIVPRDGNHLLKDGPVLVRPSGDGARPTRALYHREDAVDPRADVPRFELAFVPERSGEVHLTADCTFYLCRPDARCRPIHTTAAWTASVTAPPRP
jgi:hypothetical protein